MSTVTPPKTPEERAREAALGLWPIRTSRAQNLEIILEAIRAAVAQERAEWRTLAAHVICEDCGHALGESEPLMLCAVCAPLRKKMGEP